MKATEKPKKISSAEQEKNRARDAEVVRGIFRNLQQRGQDVKFHFRLHRQEPITMYHLTDNEICSIPLGLARHINKNCYVEQSKYVLDEHGKPLKATPQYIRRFVFDSLEFVDTEDITPFGQTPLEIAQETKRQK